jgi:hypothetical protein
MSEFVIPSWYGWVVLAMVLPGLIVLVGVAVGFLLHRPPPADDEGPRQFHVLGFDPKTNQSRELTLTAPDPIAARELGQMQGIIVSDVTPIQAASESPRAVDKLEPAEVEEDKAG